jgi:hypothetical protein
MKKKYQGITYKRRFPVVVTLALLPVIIQSIIDRRMVTMSVFSTVIFTYLLLVKNPQNLT